MKETDLQGMLASLDQLLTTRGTLQVSHQVSGRDTMEMVPSITNVTFMIKDAPEEELDHMILMHHSQSGFDFVVAEFKDWIDPDYVNPANAYKAFPERWEKMLNAEGKMDYSYHDRIHHKNQFNRVVEELIENPGTRQAYIAVYNPDIDAPRIGQGVQVPCIYGYQFHLNPDNFELNMSVLLRSCDLENCLRNDVWLANKLHNEVITRVQTTHSSISKGSMNFTIMNLHKYPNLER